jgi:hypothetical protein
MRARATSTAFLATIAALALFVAACSSSTKSSSDSKKSQPTAPKSTTPTTKLTQVVVEPAGLKVIPGTANGSSPCEKAAPTPSSPGQVGAGTGGDAKVDAAGVAASEHGERGMVEQEPLTHAERVELESQMVAARTVATKYPTVADAEKAGYVRSTPFVPCIGAHYTKVSLAGAFDAAAPSELLYDGTDPNSKIVGLSYLVWHPGGPPPGFAGANDHWHQHNANGGLCLKGGLVVGGEETTREECAARGGRKSLLIDIWMVHAWVVPGFECSWGVFSGECPELGGKLGGTAWDQ